MATIQVESAGWRVWGMVAALALARVAFGFQLQTVASLGPVLLGEFHMGYAMLGTLIGLYMLPGALVAIPIGLMARSTGDRFIIGLGIAIMALGSSWSAGAVGPPGIGAGRVIAGCGAVALTVLQGKILSDRLSGVRFTYALSALVGAFPIGIGLAQLLQGSLAARFGWPGAFLFGSGMALVPLGLLLACWTDPPVAAPRNWAWPTRRETALVVISGLIWTAYNAAYGNFLGYVPTLLAARHHPRWVTDVVMTLATWGNLPAVLLGGVLAARVGRTLVFVSGTIWTVTVVFGMAATNYPLVWGVLFGTLASLHGGLIIEMGTLSARPESRAVGMGMFYTTYYLGGAMLPAICGKAADLAGTPAGALVAAASISMLALPLYWLHRDVSHPRDA